MMMVPGASLVAVVDDLALEAGRQLGGALFVGLIGSYRRLRLRRCGAEQESNGLAERLRRNGSEHGAGDGSGEAMATAAKLVRML